MNLLLHSLLALYPGDAFALGVVRIVLLVSLPAAIALLIGRIARRDPSVRYAAGLYALFATLLSPLLLHPALQWVVLTLPAPAMPATGPAPFPGLPLVPAAVLSADFLRAAFSLIILVWGVGVVMGLAHLAGGCRTAARLRRLSHPIEDGESLCGLQSALEPICGPTPIPLHLSAQVDVPCVIGVWRPLILLPKGLLDSLTPEALHAVLAHEGAHIVLRHPAQALIQRLTCLLFWSHPLLRRLDGQIARAREEVCDNYALQVTGATCYAWTLLTMAESLSHAPDYSPTLALLGPGWRLEERIAGLLDPRRNRMVHPKSWKLWLIAMAVAGVGASAAGVRVKSAQGQPDQPLILNVQGTTVSGDYWVVFTGETLPTEPGHAALTVTGSPIKVQKADVAGTVKISK